MVLFAFVVLLLLLAYTGAPLLVSFVVVGLYLAFFTSLHWLFWLGFFALALLLVNDSLRLRFISSKLIAFIKAKNLMPKISDTEKEALNAGTTWVAKDFFSGEPNFSQIFANPYPVLTKEEKSFLENEVTTLCEMIDDDSIMQERDISPEIFNYLKEKRFFGLIIPKEYGGLEFSAYAHGMIIERIASRSSVVAITTMVPNSLGPAELLIHYGTHKQKEHYLPRLARGEEIPCFGLTEPNAGSDAASLSSYGEVKVLADGTVGIVLNFEKRYITLAAIATVIGLAFRLRDPENILRMGEDLGITCALVDAQKEGIARPMRHDPLGVCFVNSPLKGTDVIIRIEDIIGGVDGIGKGWGMLMQSLSVGRGISLPSTSTGGAKLCSLAVLGHTLARKQFGLSLYKFEGISEPLAKTLAFTYMLDAAKTFTLGAIDNYEKPSVINAIMKYHATEHFREVINMSMDILGGNAIIKGKKNLLATPYIGAPISITVEGANILTRTLMQYGQGLIRSHPYAYNEIEALLAQNVSSFDKSFFAHLGFALKVSARSLFLGLTRGHLHSPMHTKKLARIEQKLVWVSARFAMTSELMLALYGANIKKKEMMSAKMADILSWQYLITATLKRFHTEGSLKEQEAIVLFLCNYGLLEIQKAFESIYTNLGGCYSNKLFKLMAYAFKVNPLSFGLKDKEYTAIIKSVHENKKLKDALLDNVFIPTNKQEQANVLNRAYELSQDLELLFKKTGLKNIKALKQSALLNEEDLRLITEYEQVVKEAIGVDAFSLSEYKQRR